MTRREESIRMKEDIESWNELFPDCKIEQSDLSKPTLMSLVRIVVSYLRMFHYRVDPPIPLTAELNMAVRENRLFLIKLAHNIDSILKITDKSYNFTYYDFIRPTPKKTSHMLGILLNYLYYYNMYKTGVLTMASKPIKKREELMQAITEAQKNVKHKQTRTKLIAGYLEELSVLKANAEELETQKILQAGELEKFKQVMEELDRKYSELQMQERNLKKQIVPNTDAKNLQQQHKVIQENIADHQKLERAIDNNLKECNEKIKSLEHLLKRLESITDAVPENIITILKQKKEINEIKAKHAKLKNEKQHAMDIITKQEQALKACDEMNLRNTQLTEELAAQLQAINEKEKISKDNTEKLNQLQKEDAELSRVMQIEMDVSCFVHNFAETLMMEFFLNE